WLGLLSILGVVLGSWHYGRQSMRLQREGGEVREGPPGLPDLALSFVHGGFLALLAMLSFHQSTQGALEITREVIVANGGFQLALAGCVVIFLMTRRIRVREVVHPGRLSVAGTLWHSVIMLICALPIVGVFNGIAGKLLPQDMRSEQ